MDAEKKILKEVISIFNLSNTIKKECLLHQLCTCDLGQCYYECIKIFSLQEN